MYGKILPLIVLIFFTGCAPRPQVLRPQLPDTYLIPASYDALGIWEGEAYDELLELFRKNCRSREAQRLYGALCDQAETTERAGRFFRREFEPYQVVTPSGEGTGLMTGYYEPLLHGSLEPSGRYRYPLYGEPEDLLEIELAEIYPELEGKRLRGRLAGKKVVPYYDRGAIALAGAPVICWVDDRVSLFFLEVQGSGRIELEEGGVLHVGYRNQNGRPYRSIGKYLVETGEIAPEAVSLQAIRTWFEAHPDRMEEVLNRNPSVVFFQTRERGATGSLGLELTPGRSIAVDRRYIPLGAMLYLQAEDPRSEAPLERVVFAQDTGGAIQGRIRADFFWGFGPDAEAGAGRMKADARFWILLPKETR
jgi:membrane-bound lytic murein transglycosylase A